MEFDNKLIDVESYVNLVKRKSLMFDPIFDAMEEGIEACDENGKVFYVNESFLRLTGLRKDERQDLNILEMNPNGLLAKVLKSRQPVLNSITTDMEQQFQALGSAFPLYENQKFVGAVLLLKDVSQAVQLSKELNQRDLYQSEINKHATKYSFSDVVANEDNMKFVVARAREMALAKNPVWIQGELGTGKDLFASAIHSMSSRNKRAFMRLDCSKGSDKEISYQLFGYEKNAFPDADRMRVGLLESVDGGTIYLDHMDKLPLPTQVKVIRSLKEQKIYRIGGTNPIPVQTRLIASSTDDLTSSFEKGLIHEDLYNYVKEYDLHLPPLRERKEDFPDLANDFIQECNHQLGKSVKGMAKEALELMLNYTWPGNLNQLKAVITSMISSTQADMITKEMVLAAMPYEFVDSIQNSMMSLKEMERLAIAKALKYYGHSLSGKQQAAQMLQISIGTLYNKMRDYNL